MRSSTFAALLIIAAYLIWNVIVFIMYAADKNKARRGDWRIPEKTLLLSAFLMGGAGAFAGMRVFRHKTKHIQFRVIVPVSMVLNLAAMVFLLSRLLSA